MGMAASQARFLGLTARKTNVEYEGQQVNQQRTTLSNQSANYYNQLLGMEVPTPPSVQDYTKTVYSFTDGSLQNTVTSLIAQADGNFLISYTRSYTDTSAVVSTSSSIITRTGEKGTGYSYSVGAIPLRKLGEGFADGEWENDPYLSTLTKQQREKLQLEEQAYIEKLNIKYCGATGPDDKTPEHDGDWQVYYKYDSTTETYNPVFYRKNDLEKDTTIYSDTTGASQSFIPAYTTGQEKVSDEIKGTIAKLEQDSTGRYINITLFESDEDGNPVGEGTTYALTTNTTTDQAAYNDAMNQYEYDKATYDKSIQEINNKIEIIQLEDKNLELRLKQLDTEQDAIQTEMDAVQKVIEKNVESTFKTFG